MHWQVFLLIGFLSLSPFTHSALGDFVTDINTVGRSTGNYKIYFPHFEKGAVQLHVRQCSVRSSDPRPMTRFSCDNTIYRLPLRPVQEALIPGIENELFRQTILSENATVQQAVAELARRLRIQMTEQGGGEARRHADFFRSFLGELESGQQQAQRIAQAFFSEHQFKLSLLGKIMDTRTYYLHADDSLIPPSERGAAIDLTRALPRILHRSVGYVCAQTNSHVSNEGGGCKVNSTGVIYSASHSTVDPLMIDGWLNRDAAALRCHLSAAGGFNDWRLPTSAELTNAIPHHREIGFDPYLYYWTSQEGEERSSETRRLRLGNQTIESSSRRVLIGYNTTTTYSGLYIMSSRDQGPHTHSRPIYSNETSEVVETGRNLHARYDVRVSTQSLIRPTTGENFQIRRHALQGATGTITSQLQRTETRPGVISMDTYSRFLGQYRSTSPRVDTRESSTVNLGQRQYEVNPFDYVSYELPRDLNRNQIGLICVRRP